MKRSIAAACIILAALTALEFGLRRYYSGASAAYRPHSMDARIHEYFYFDDDGTFRIRPNVSGWGHSYDGNYDVRVDINEEGLRGPALLPRPGKRFAFLGDSITFDGGVPWDKSFVALIQSRFRTVKGRENWEFLNFGTTDAGIKEYYLKLKNHALRLRPDAVVVCLYLNDSRPPQGFLGENGQKPWEFRLKESMLYRSYIVKALYQMARRVSLARDPALKERFRWAARWNRFRFTNDFDEWRQLVIEAEYDWGAAWKEESWKTIEDYLVKIRALCRTNGCALYCVLFPVTPQVIIETPFPMIDYPQRVAGQIAQRLGIPFCDLLPVFKAHRDTRLFTDQCHLTTDGNRVAADAIAAFLAQQYPEK